MAKGKITTKKDRKKLYEFIWDARESCCGSSVKDKDILINKLTVALLEAHELQIDNNVLDKLREARKIILKSRNYYDRLPADDILCEILNEEMK